MVCYMMIWAFTLDLRNEVFLVRLINHNINFNTKIIADFNPILFIIRSLKQDDII